MCTVRLWAIATLAFASAVGAQAHAFQIVGDVEQSRQIEQSLAACPSLDARLDSLAKSSGFRQIRVTSADETKKEGPFLAAVVGSEILLASDWLALQRQPYSDVRHEGEILPDNLCFDLGHLSEHVAHPPSRPQRGIAITAWVDEHLRAESQAFLRAWPFVLEAAQAQNGGRPLNGRQVGDLLLNLRYRFAFFKAMNTPTGPKLSILADGRIAETEPNIDAITGALSNSSIADLQ